MLIWYAKAPVLRKHDLFKRRQRNTEQSIEREPILQKLIKTDAYDKKCTYRM
jgi:hypothetical protein